jgi:hypothetical protein
MYFQGRPLLGSLQVVGVFKEMVRRHHVLFSIFCAHDDAQVVLTLTQRVTVGDMPQDILFMSPCARRDCLTLTCKRHLVMLCCVQVLACLIFTSLGVTALLLGRRSGSAIDRAFAGMVAAGCMLPCRMLLPRLYKAANAPPKDKVSATSHWCSHRQSQLAGDVRQLDGTGSGGRPGSAESARVIPGWPSPTMMSQLGTHPRDGSRLRSTCLSLGSEVVCSHLPSTISFLVCGRVQRPQ